MYTLHLTKKLNMYGILQPSLIVAQILCSYYPLALTDCINDASSNLSAIKRSTATVGDLFKCVGQLWTLNKVSSLETSHMTPYNDHVINQSAPHHLPSCVYHPRSGRFVETGETCTPMI